MSKMLYVLILFLFFAGCGKKNSGNNEVNETDELKKKELELREKELVVREKEALKNKERELEIKEQDLKNQKEFVEYLKETPKYESKNSDLPGRYPEASLRYLSVNEVSRFSSYELRLMRNEIFARHGYIFKSEDLRNYFNSQNWYQASYEDVNSMLSKIEKTNIDLIKKYE